MDDLMECKDCGQIYDAGDMVDGLCADCSFERDKELDS